MHALAPFARTIAFTALVAAGLFAPGTGSAIADTAADKAAEKQLKTTQAQVLATFRTSLATDTRAFTAAVVAIEKTVASDAPAAAQSLFDALVTLQTAVTSHVKTAADGQATAARDILASLMPTTEGVYPPALYPGDGTPTAAFEDAVDAVLAKTYVKLRKRLAKTMQRIERAGTHVDLRIKAPRRPVRVWNSHIIDFLVLPEPTIDVVLAFSTAAQRGDGKLRVAGEASQVSSPAIPIDDDVSATAVFNGQSADQKVTPVAGRWSLDFGDASFAEGVWLVLAAQNLISADTSIGVR